MQDWTLSAVGVAVALALLALGLGVSLYRSRSRTGDALAAARRETAALRARLEALEQRLAGPARPTTDDSEYVITHLGEDERDPVEPARIETALFADLVLRESVVKMAGLAHGLRRALDPETRNRIRFEMRREVRRARKQRRADARQARRESEGRRGVADDANDPDDRDNAA